MPLEIINLVAPVFLVIITGFLLGRFFHLFKPEAGDILIKFAFYVTVPALLLLVLTTTPIKNILNWNYILVYGGGTLVFFMLITLIAKTFFGKSFAESTIIGSLSSLTNMGFIGLPLTLALFGHRAVAPATLAILLLVIVFYPLMIIFIELSNASTGSTLTKFKKIFLSISTNPIILPAFIGLALSSMNIQFPTLLQNYFKIFENALTPCALFAIGMGIEIDKIKGYFKDLFVLTLIKLIVMPALIFLLAKSLGMSPFYIVLVVIAVAIPPAKSTYVIASQYNVIKDESAATISFATLASIVTLFAWLLFFAKLYPSLFMGQ